MKKKLIALAAAVLLAAAMAAAVFVLNRDEKKAAETETAAAGETAYLVRLENISSVKVENGAGGYTVINSAADGSSQAVLAGWEQFPADVFYVNQVISLSGALQDRGLVEEAPASLAVYGLDKPRAAVHIAAAHNAVTVLVGNAAPDKNNVYAMISGGTAVHLIYQSDADTYLKSPLDFMEKTISPDAPKDERQQLIFDEIDFGGTVRGGKDIVIRNLHIQPPAVPSPGAPVNTFLMTAPIESPMNQERINALEALFGLRAGKVAARISGPADAAAYGLDKPYSTARVSGTLGRGLGGFALKASAPDQYGDVFIQREGTDLVFQITSASLPWLSLGWFSFRQKLVILPYIDSVSAVDVIIRGEKTTFTLSGEGSTLKVTAGGKDIPESNFRTYYQTLICAMYDEEYSGPVPTAAPVLQFRYHYRGNDNVDVVSIWEAGSRRVITSLNGGVPAYTLSVYVDKVIADLPLVLRGEKVLPYL